MRTMKIMAVLVMAAALALTLAACGGSAGSAASSSASESSSAGASSGESSGASSAAASEGATGQAPSESYMPAKIDVTHDDGSTMVNSYTYDDRERLLAGGLEMASSDSAYDVDVAVTDWDENGHPVKTEETDDFGDGKPFTTTTEVLARELNADGTIASITQVTTLGKESFEEGEVASTKITFTWDYGDDVQICRKLETKTECFDESGALLTSETQTNEFDEDGLQTRYTSKAVDAEGAESNTTGDITWTKDADGKPVSYTMVLSQDGADTVTNTGDVKTDGSGLISRVGNVKIDGKACSTTATIDYVKIDDPLPNAYECWKNFTLTDMIL